MKTILIIILLTATSLFAQDTCRQLIITNFRKPNMKVDTVYYLCDTVKIKNSSQSQQDTNDIKKEYELISAEYQKVLKQLEQLTQDKYRLEGVMLYLEEKFKQEKKK